MVWPRDHYWHPMRPTFYEVLRTKRLQSFELSKIMLYSIYMHASFLFLTVIMLIFLSLFFFSINSNITKKVKKLKKQASTHYSLFDLLISNAGDFFLNNSIYLFIGLYTNHLRFILFHMKQAMSTLHCAFVISCNCAKKE